MNKIIEIFIDYLLDTETTSEISFNQAIYEKKELYNKDYQSIWEKIINRKLQQWKDFYEKEQRTLAERIEINAGNEILDSESEQDLSSDDEDKTELQKTTTIQQQDQKHQSIKHSSISIDPISQCKRLLQLLYYCQQDHLHFVNLYFHLVDHCMKYENEKIIAIALQQIALHLSEDVHNQNEYQRLMKYIPSSNISQLHKPIISTIKNLLSTNKTKQDTISFDDLDILYPCTARYLDLRREFRDSTHYFIDGDSLILSVAHHINLDLKSYHGNTLHIIFLIERILLTLFHQTYQCNYTLIFFDCHYQFYQHEESILSLIRSCFISHLNKNTNEYHSTKVEQFSSWLDNDYTKFIQEEKPHFIFYHDMSSFNIDHDRILSKNALNKLRYIYRLFGNYHQYYIRIHLYLMNKLNLTDTIVQCFEIKFSEICSKKLFQKAVEILPNYEKFQHDDLIEFEQEINQNDVRMILYLKTLIKLIKDDDLFKPISPLFILHIALLHRLSLIDRHLPKDFPSITYSSIFSKLIIRFQHTLALYVSSYSSTFSWKKIVDLFDGRLFAFTLYQLSKGIFFDSNTNDLIQQCLSILKISNDKNLFFNIIEQLIQLKYIEFSSSIEIKSMEIRRQRITRISNSFIDTFLKPILSTDKNLTFDFDEPKDTRLIPYEGKHHWHVYKEVGDEISRIRDNDQQNKNSTRYRYRTKHQQRFYTYFTLYGRSLTSRDVRDNQLQIILPTPSTNQLNSSSTNNKKSKNKTTIKKETQTKAQKIIEENKQRKLEKRTTDETDQLNHVEELLKQLSIDNYEKLTDTIDECLSNFKTSINRFELLKKKISFSTKIFTII